MTRIRRYKNHHVRLFDQSFTVEHPLTCDLEECDIYDRASEAWDSPPGALGWYRLNDDLTIQSAEERIEFFVVPVGRLDPDTIARVVADEMVGRHTWQLLSDDTRKKVDRIAAALVAHLKGD